MNITNWEQAYQENFTPWDKDAPSPPLVEWLAQNELKGRVLVPGCGLGHDVALLAAHGAQPVGLDLSETAVERAKVRHPKLKDCFIQGDLFEHSSEYDALVEHTCLCALPPEWRLRYRDAAARLIKPGGLLVGVFFINPDMDPGETGPPFGISEEELTALFADSFEIEHSHVPQTSYEGRESRELLRVLRRRS